MPDVQKELNHQELIDELVLNMARYEQVRNEESLLIENMQSLQKKLFDAGINYKIPMLEPNVQKTDYQKQKESYAQRKESYREEKKGYRTLKEKLSIKLTYDTVTKSADSIMNSGRAVSVHLLATNLNVEDKNTIKKYLDKAVSEGKYEKRKSTMFAFPVKFDVYEPKGKDLPFLPAVVSANEYKSMMEISKKIMPEMKRKFTQKEFYQKFKPQVEKEGLGLKKVQMSIPSILHAYVSKGLLRTKDQNTHSKTMKKKTEFIKSQRKLNGIFIDDTPKSNEPLLNPKDEREALSDFYRK